VPIDFGMAFGMGASVLPVPELLPFRLTPQFTALLRPLDSLGLLQRHATIAMGAFKAQAAVLVRTMDVFLQDPIVDWVESCAAKQRPKGDEAADADSQAAEGSDGQSELDRPVWEPTRRIRNARRKLEGFNPVALLVDDLKQNPAVDKFKSLAALEAILRGQPGGASVPLRCVEPRLQAAKLSTADQVSCLVDVATDPNVLGRQWIGLATWI